MSGPADASEVGRELLAADLKSEMIVFISPPQPASERPVMFTMWVVKVLSDVIVFYSGVQRSAVASFITPEGGLVDDQGRQVRVFEYLGEP